MAEKLSKDDLYILNKIVWDYIQYRRKEGRSDLSDKSDVAFKLKWKLDKIIVDSNGG